MAGLTFSGQIMAHAMLVNNSNSGWQNKELNTGPVDHIIHNPIQAESMVKVLKQLIEKAILHSKPWYFYLQEQRTTPISGTILSPVEILFGRKM